MIVIGIDPGFDGGVAIIRDGTVVLAEPMPVVGAKHREIDGGEFRDMVRSYDSIDLAVIERVGVMPKQGIVSGFNFGMGVGIIRGVLAAMRIRLIDPTPQAWKKLVLAGTKKDKDAAIQHVRKSWPEVDLMPGKKRTPHDGIADSVCLAEYGLLMRRTLGGL